MDSGAFLDLSSIIDNDALFHIEDYNQVVLDAGLYKGGRYFMPYSYTVPLLFTIPDTLDTVGFDISRNTNFVSLFEEIATALPKIEESAVLNSVFSYYWDYRYAAVNDFGLQLIDYEQQKVLSDEDALRAFCYAFKPYWEIDSLDRSGELWNRFTGDYTEVKKGSALFGYNRIITNFWSMPFGSSVHDIKEARIYDTPYHLTAVFSKDGGLNATMRSALAIRTGSNNQLNAWNFIKTMLSQEVQRGVDNFGSPNGFPVNNNAMQRILQRITSDAFASWDNPGGTRHFAPINADDKRIFQQLLDSVTGCVVANVNVVDIFYDVMGPYFTGEMPYDECVENLRRRLRLYISE
jgi:ABC-type glycerol-3-phosphate transport system substrate-binding protein